MCTDCKNGHCHSCHREIVGAEHQVACHRNGGWSLKDRCEAFLASIGGEGK